MCNSILPQQVFVSRVVTQSIRYLCGAVAKQNWSEEQPPRITAAWVQLQQLYVKLRVAVHLMHENSSVLVLSPHVPHRKPPFLEISKNIISPAEVHTCGKFWKTFVMLAADLRVKMVVLSVISWSSILEHWASAKQPQAIFTRFCRKTLLPPFKLFLHFSIENWTSLWKQVAVRAN